MYRKGSWTLGTYLNGLGSPEGNQIQKLVFCNNMAWYRKCIWIHPTQTDYLCTPSVWCLPKMDPLNLNILLWIFWDIQQVFLSGGSQQLAWVQKQNFCRLHLLFFSAGMNIILEYSLIATTPQFHLNNISLPPMRIFMGDLNNIFYNLWCKNFAPPLYYNSKLGRP